LWYHRPAEGLNGRIKENILNKARRKKLYEALDIVVAVMDEEQEDYDKLSASVQETDQGLTIRLRLHGLADCCDSLGKITEEQ